MASTFDDTRFPSLAEAMYESGLRRLNQQPTENRSGLVGPGISASIDQSQATLGRGLQLVGDLLGSQSVSDTGAGIAERNNLEAAQNGRPDLESFPTDDLTKIPAWLTYQVSKQLPNLAAQAALYKLGARSAARFMPAGAVEAGAVMPKFLGGGGLRAGMSAAAAEAARAQGARFAAGIAAQAPLQLPLAAGSLYDQAVESGNAGRGAAIASLVGAVPYALMDSFEPGVLGKALERGLTKGVLKRVATGAAVNAATETVSEGVQTGMEQAFRTDLPIRERLANVVEGAVTGGAVGGVFGGFSGAIGGMRQVKTANPAALTNDDIKGTVDQALSPDKGLTPDPNGQLRMPGTEERARPTTGAQNFAGEPDVAPSITPQRATLFDFPATPAGEDFDRAVQGPFRSEISAVPPEAAAQAAGEARRMYPEGSVGTAQWKRYEDVGGPSGAEIAQRAAAQMDAVQADTGAEPASSDQGMFDLRANGDVLREQASPDLIAKLQSRFEKNEATEQDRAMVRRLGLESQMPVKAPTAEENAQLDAQTNDLLGGSKNIWQKNILSQPARDIVDRVAQVSELVGQYVNNGITIPKGLVTTGQKLGLLDEQGNPQEPGAVRDALVARRDELYKRAQATGEGAGEAAAVNKSIAEWDKKAAVLAQATQRLQERADAAARVAEAQVPLSEDQRPSTIEESASVLWGAPPVALPQTLEQRLQQRFQQRGTSTAMQTQSAAPAPVVTKQDVAAKQRKQNQRRVEARAQERARVVPPPSADPTAAIQEQRKQVIARLNSVANDVSLDEVGQQGLRQRAVAAAAAYTAGTPGADKAAYRVLAAHGRATGGTVFSTRRLSEAQPPMSDQSFEQSLIKVANALPTAAREAIYVVDSAQELPPEVLEAAEMQNMDPREIRGVLHDGKVYVVKNQVSSEAELQEVVDHEVFGHGGARALLGDQRRDIMSRVFQMAGGLEGLRQLARQFGVEAALNEYLPGRDLTVEDQVALTDELLAQAAGKATGKFKTFALAWVSRFKSALINLLRAVGLDTAADRLNTFSAADMAEMLVRMREAVENGGALNGDGVQFLRSTPQGLLQSTKNLYKTADNVRDWVRGQNVSELSLNVNKFHLYTSSAGHIVSFFGKLFEYRDPQTGNIINPLKNWWDANVIRGVTEQRFAHLVKIGYGKFEEVARNAPEAAKDIGSLMKYTFYAVDPRKTWDEQAWLHSDKDAANLKKHADEAHKAYRRLKQVSPTAAAAYETFIDTNEAMHFAQQAVSLYNLLLTDEDVTEAARAKLESQIEDPMKEFLGDAAKYNDPRAARDYWKSVTDKLVNKTDEYVREQRGLLGLTDKQAQAKINRNTSTLDARVRTIRAQQTAMSQAPYFHLGRFGNYVVSFHIKKDASGKLADRAAMDKIADRFHKAGIDGIEIPADATRGNAYIRFENLSQAEAAKKIALELAAEGVVLDGGKDKIELYDRRTETKNDFDMSRAPAWAEKLMSNIRAKEFGNMENMTDDEKKVAKALNNEFERYVQQFFVDLLPDTSLTKVMVHRNNVPGFSADMVRSYLFRTQVGGRALANLYASSKMSDARAAMTAAKFAARSEADTKTGMIKQNVVEELFLRDSQRAQTPKNNWIDQWRAWNHAYFLGLSPSYAAVNLTQIGVLLWPELAKKHGFMNSARAIAKVTPTAIRLITAVVKEAQRQGGWRAMPDASITLDVLNRPEFKDMPAAQKAFILRVVNSGILDIGSQSRELGRVVEGLEDSKSDTALRVAASFGYYTEMVSRLVAALAARDLHGGTNANEDMFQYVDDTVRQSMLSYETWNQARATGRMGLAGEFTPVMTSFMQYTFQLTEKLYREFHQAFMDSDAKPEQKAEARAFLGTHLAAIVTLTGTLGMPMASAFAAAFDGLANTLWKDDDDEPMDVKNWWRNLLADTLGKTAGEVVARGVPRALGFDISSRAGEQDMIPYLHMFSKLLTDKRDWEDKIADDTFRMLGSPISMGSNIIMGGSKMMNGDILEGMADMVPAALKGPVKAYELSQDGYVDKKGNRMPNVTAGASDIMWQALGFNPARRAENAEASNDQRILRGAMTKKARRIREDLAVALEQGDMAAARDLWRKAQEFDRKNPEFQILKNFKSTLTSRARERQKSKQSGAPLGAKPGLADRTDYANTN